MRNATMIPRLMSFLTVLVACACGGSTEPDPLDARSADGVVFLALRAQPSVHMEALFQGRVILDDAGCLRLDSPDNSTVVWPYGARLDGSGSALRVVAAGGAEIGRIGGSFRFGGGHIPFLHDGIGLAQADRDRAQNCPGDYWIVGEVY